MAGKYNKIPDILRRLILAWLIAAAFEMLRLPSVLRELADTEVLSYMSLSRVLTITAVVFAVLMTLTRFADTREYERWGLLVGFVLLASTCLTGSFTWPFFVVCILVLAALLLFALRGWKQAAMPVCKPGKAGKGSCLAVAVLAVLFFAFVSFWSVARVRTFCTPTFDFGLFAQMFHNMKTSGLPMTTLERDGLLSHFAVHVSPIYYLMLPFYCLVPTPETLQVLQAAVLASAVIPLWKLTGRHGFSGIGRVLCCALLLLYPAYSGGTSYDLHENCFLTPLILWLFYGIERKNGALTLVSALLTLMVKEDAAVYVAVMALWLLLKTAVGSRKSKWDLCAGLLLFISSLAWFFAVTGFLAKSGDGVMTYRYDNFMYGDSSSLLTVVKAVVMNPMKAVYECVDSEKLPFIWQTMLPLLFMPLLTRRYERYILLIPYLLVNLMSDYSYQHDILFQYTFGSTAFLMYLTVVNLSELKIDTRRTLALTAALVICAGCFWKQILPSATGYAKRIVREAEQNAVVRAVLAEIPEDASVTAATFYTTSISQRETLYDLRYCSMDHLLESEYVVLEPSRTADFRNYVKGEEDGYENLQQILTSNGYVIKEAADEIVVYHKDQ